MTIQSRVFLVGCPRSGTTLLQCLLGAHSRMAAYPETQFFSSLYSQRRWAARLGLASGRSRLAWQLFVRGIGRPELLRRLPRHAVLARQGSTAFVATLDQLTREQHKDVWVEKTPGHLRVMAAIERLVPGAQFVHIVRHGPDVVASLYDVGVHYPNAEWAQEFRSLDTCIDRWVHDARLSQARAGQPNHRLVRYEALVADPEAVLRPLCQFVGVAYEPSMLTDYGRVAGQVITRNETWKAATFQAIRTDSGAKFQTVFDADQQRYVREHIPPDLRGSA